jgi:hypothetical protein
MLHQSQVIELILYATPNSDGFAHIEGFKLISPPPSQYVDTWNLRQLLEIYNVNQVLLGAVS